MTSDSRRSCRARRLLPLLLAFGIGPVVAGCCNMAPNYTEPAGFQSAQPRPGSQGFDQKVNADRFPSGPDVQK